MDLCVSDGLTGECEWYTVDPSDTVASLQRQVALRHSLPHPDGVRLLFPAAPDEPPEPDLPLSDAGVESGLPVTLTHYRCPDVMRRLREGFGLRAAPAWAASDPLAAMAAVSHRGLEIVDTPFTGDAAIALRAAAQDIRVLPHLSPSLLESTDFLLQVVNAAPAPPHATAVQLLRAAPDALCDARVALALAERSTEGDPPLIPVLRQAGSSVPADLAGMLVALNVAEAPHADGAECEGVMLDRSLRDPTAAARACCPRLGHSVAAAVEVVRQQPFCLRYLPVAQRGDPAVASAALAASPYALAYVGRPALLDAALCGSAVRRAPSLLARVPEEVRACLASSWGKCLPNRPANQLQLTAPPQVAPQTEEGAEG